MIKLRIQRCLDRDVVGKKEYNLNSLDLGKTRGTLLIDDPDIVNSHLRFMVTSDRGEGQGLIEVHPSATDVLVSGKRATGTMPIKNGDVIKLKNTDIRVEELKYDQVASKNDVIVKCKERITKERIVIDEVLNALEKTINPD